MTVTVVCVALPVGSMLLTAMVLPVTESTMPLTPRLPAGLSGGGHLPPSDGLISTDSAVAAPPSGALCAAGLTSTQLPGFTSVSAADESSVTIVAGVKSTAAAVRSRCVSWILLSETDLTRPSTSSWPIGGAGGGLGGEVVELADVLGFPVFSLLELPHAASDAAVAPVTPRIASRVNRRRCVVADIRVLRSSCCAEGYPLHGRRSRSLAQLVSGRLLRSAELELRHVLVVQNLRCRAHYRVGRMRDLRRRAAVVAGRRAGVGDAGTAGSRRDAVAGLGHRGRTRRDRQFAAVRNRTAGKAGVHRCRQRLVGSLRLCRRRRRFRGGRAWPDHRHCGQPSAHVRRTSRVEPPLG